MAFSLLLPPILVAFASLPAKIQSSSLPASTSALNKESSTQEHTGVHQRC